MTVSSGFKPSLCTTPTQKGGTQSRSSSGTHRMVGSTANSPARPSSTFNHLPNSSNLLHKTKFKELETKFKELETKFIELELHN